MKILRMLVEITIEALCSAGYFVKTNLWYFATILSAVLPYAMYFIGQRVAINEGGIVFNAVLLIPAIFIVLTYYLKSIANKIGKGTNIPVPNKRFTKKEYDGEVTIRNDRVKELIIYVADLEDWLERKGLL